MTGFGPGFFKLIHLAIYQRLVFNGVWWLKRCFSHSWYLVEVFLLTTVEKRFYARGCLGNASVLLSENELFTAPSLLNAVHDLDVVLTDTSNKLLLEFFIRYCFIRLACQCIESRSSTTYALIIYLLVVHWILKQHAKS